LREEHKEKRVRHEKLQTQQAEANKNLTKLATEVTLFRPLFMTAFLENRVLSHFLL
jgi:hypothetical protein